MSLRKGRVGGNDPTGGAFPRLLAFLGEKDTRQPSTNN